MKYLQHNIKWEKGSKIGLHDDDNFVNSTREKIRSKYNKW